MSNTSTASTNPHISQIQALKRQKIGQREAQDLLVRLSNHVTPIMKKRGWRVGKLLEFLPKDPQLLGLNVNRGQVVKIRLRPAFDDSTFYPFNDLLGTMLHELVHNAISPHDASFYKQLDELWEEYEAGIDMRNPDGANVGGSRLTPEEAKRQQIAAAEKREAINKIMPSGGRKLGGSGRHVKDIRSAILDAAERRARDSKWCGAIDLDDSDDDEATKTRMMPSSNAGGLGPTSKQAEIELIILTDSDEEPPPPKKKPRIIVPTSAEQIEWACKVCTLKNPSSYLSCDACTTSRN